MVWDSARQAVVVGQGYDNNFVPSSSFYAFDPTADGGGWSPLVTTSTASARSGAAFLGDLQPLHVWAGVDDNGDLSNELYRLDLPDGGPQWTAVAAANPPSARGYPTGVSVAGRRLIFGGYGVQGFNTIALRDIWELEEDAGWTLTADGGIPFAHPGTVFTTAVARE